MTKNVYIVNYPDGTSSEIHTNRTFTHAVVARHDGETDWFRTGACSSLALAQKLARRQYRCKVQPEQRIVTLVRKGAAGEEADPALAHACAICGL